MKYFQKPIKTNLDGSLPPSEKNAMSRHCATRTYHNEKTGQTTELPPGLYVSGKQIRLCLSVFGSPWYLGTFPTLEEAILQRDLAYRLLEPWMLRVPEDCVELKFLEGVRPHPRLLKLESDLRDRYPKGSPYRRESTVPAMPQRKSAEERETARALRRTPAFDPVFEDAPSEGVPPAVDPSEERQAGILRMCALEKAVSLLSARVNTLEEYLHLSQPKKTPQIKCQTP